MNEYVRMPYSGIGTFLGVPIIYNLDEIKEGEVIFIGIPYDMGTTYRSGTRFGPNAIRNASLLYTYHKSLLFNTTHRKENQLSLWDINRKKFILKDVQIRDAGDISIVPADISKSFENITEAVKKIIDKRALPVFVGGDHSITYPILRAFCNYENIHIIHFDTHIDTWENVGQAELGHGSPLFHIQQMPNIKTITHIGLHGFLNDEDRYIDAIKRGHNIITADNIHNNRIDLLKHLPMDELYYLSFDIDVFDPAYAPGTGTAEFGGLTPMQVFSLLEIICKGKKFIGMDLVEVSPPYDHANMTSLLAAQVIIIFVDIVAGKKE